MAAKYNSLEDILTEVLHHGRNKPATYSHVECRIGGIERVAMIYRSLSTWVRNGPNSSATYIFVNTADFTTAKAKMGHVSTDGGRENRISLVTYDSWVDEENQVLENRGNLIFLMDMGFGVRTAGMSVAAMKMLHDMQGLLRGRQTGTTITWISVSCAARALLSEKPEIQADGLLLPSFEPPILCNQDRALAKSHGPQRPDNKNWQADAVYRIHNECHKDFTRIPRPDDVAFACVMSVEDAHRIRNDLAVLSWPRMVSIDFIQPWMDSNAIYKAISGSIGIKIICIDPRVSVIPSIHNLQAIILAPWFSVPTFDINTTAVVTTKGFYDVATALAYSLKRFEARNSTHVDVHVFPKLARPESTSTPGFQPEMPEQKIETSTASDRDCVYLNMVSITATGNYAHAAILSMTTPASAPELDEARRRLEVWHLLERTEDHSVTHPRFKPTSIFGQGLSKYATDESNIHSLITLGFVKPEMSVCTRQVLVDLAMLVSQGLSSFFDLSTTEGQRDHRETIQKLGDTAGFARRHCHKGLLWQALAYLHCFRKFKCPINRGPHDQPNTVLDEAIRLEALRVVAGRVHSWKYRLKIPIPDEAYALSDEEFPTVEKIVATAFAFNFMRVPVEDAGYFGRDITSDVILEEEADGEAVDWDVLKKEARDGGDLQVMAIYTHLNMEIVDNDLKVYRAVGTTAISNLAFCNGLMDLGIEHYRSLRPPVKPDRRCLIPRGSF